MSYEEYHERGNRLVAVPIWGIFLILLAAVIGGGGWFAYEYGYRRPRIEEIKRLHQSWKSWSVRESDRDIADELDRLSRERFGVPASRLPELLP